MSKANRSNNGRSELVSQLIDLPVALVIDADEAVGNELVQDLSRHGVGLKVSALDDELLLELVVLLELPLGLSSGLFFDFLLLLNLCSGPSSLDANLEHVSTDTFRGTHSMGIGKGGCYVRVEFDAKVPLCNHGLVPSLDPLLDESTKLLRAEGHHDVHEPVPGELLHLFLDGKVDLEVWPVAHDDVPDVDALEVLVVRHVDPL